MAAKRPENTHTNKETPTEPASEEEFLVSNMDLSLTFLYPSWADEDPGTDDATDNNGYAIPEAEMPG